MSTVGERIKKRRKELHMSVDDLAKILNKNRATIYRYESDDIENMPTTVLEPLSEALGVTPIYLMGWDEQQKNIRNLFSNNLQKCMNANKLNLNDIAKIVDVSVEQVNSWLSTEDTPTLAEIQKIADYFNISIDQFENADNIFSSQSITLSYEEKQIIDMYRSMSEGNKEAVFTLMKNLSHPL